MTPLCGLSRAYMDSPAATARARTCTHTYVCKRRLKKPAPLPKWPELRKMGKSNNSIERERARGGRSIGARARTARTRLADAANGKPTAR